MIPLGTIVNIIAVLLGSIIGLILKKKINPDLNKKIFFIMGLFTLVLGLNMALESQDLISIFLSLIFGTIFGEYYNLDQRLNQSLQNIKINKWIKDDNFTEGIVTAFLLFCVGSMTIIGSIEEGLGKPPDILYTKSIMDGISSIVLASILGVGVAFSILPMFFFQSGITLFVFFNKDFMPTILIEQVGCLGGFLIIAIGLKILGYKQLNPINMLPSLPIIAILYFL